MIICAVLAGFGLRLRSACAPLRYGRRATAGAQIITRETLNANRSITRLRESFLIVLLAVRRKGIARVRCAPP